MSNQAETQRNTSPPALVRAKTPPNPGHGLSASSPSDPEEVTPKSLAQTGRSRTAPAVHKNSLLQSSVDRPQLSERDSIFATTYLAADSPTSSPRTSARSVTTDDDAFEHRMSDVAAPVPSSRRLIDAPALRRKQSGHPAVLPTHLYPRKRIVAGMEQDHERYTPSPSRSPGDTSIQQLTTLHRPDVRSALDKVENNEQRSRNKAWREGKVVAFKGTGAPEDIVLEGDIEKNIDVTLAKTEQPASARSRKASHYLRVFKDADGSEGLRTGDVRGKEQRSMEEARLALKEEEEHERPTTGGYSALTEQLRALSRPSSATQSPHGRPVNSYFEEVPPHWREAVLDDATSNAYTARGEDRPIHKQPIPAHVLEEIRTIANLTPGGQPGSSFSRSLPTSATERYHAHVATTATRHEHGEPTNYFQAKSEDVERSPASDEEDSEREQISSALYFPHRRPKESEEVSLDERNHELTRQSTQKMPAFFEGEAPSSWAQGGAQQSSQEVDISLQSQDTNQSLHGDTHKPPYVQREDEQPLAITNVDALSAESETESLAESTHSLLDYDSSATDDLGTTPTATTQHIESKATPAQAAQPPAPLDAVELKPYDHQVGGHSTVYRFSRRAVCKQLNNRENEFYETVERQHPELLEFLPRYDLICPNSISEAETQRRYHFPFNLYLRITTNVVFSI
jgi:hypothetical protein